MLHLQNLLHFTIHYLFIFLVLSVNTTLLFFKTRKMVFMEQVFSYIHDQNNTAIDWISHEGVDIICINIELFTQLTGKRTNTWLQHFSRDTQCENVTSRCRLDKNQFVCFHHPELDRYSPVGVYQSLKKNVKREGFVKQSIANKRQKLKK